MRGIKPPALDNPTEFPMLFVHVWDAFLRLSSSRSNNGFSANPISYLDIEAYCRLTDSHFSELELDALRQLDSMMIKNFNKDSK